MGESIALHEDRSTGGFGLIEHRSGPLALVQVELDLRRVVMGMIMVIPNGGAGHKDRAEECGEWGTEHGDEDNRSN
jgi:hypothetical protein